jgi:arylsulfatase A-like enzyme
VQAHVTQRDLAPTIADLLGVAQEPAGKDRSLVPLALGAEGEADRVVMIGPISTFGAGAVMSGRWKLVYGLFNDSYALFDLVGDPGEQLNVFEAKPQVAHRMATLMRTLLDDPYHVGPAVTAGDGELGWKPVAASAPP